MLRVVIFIIAIGAGSLAGWLALSMQSGDTPAIAAAPAPQEPMEDVLVASAELPQGQALNETGVRWQPWPKGAVNPGFISRTAKPDALTSLQGAVVRSHFVAGEPIREEKLARASAGLLATLLPSGKRAVAIRVSVESTAGGFILPNDRVDVVQTLPAQAGGGIFSRILLSNIRVLAVDQKADETKGQAVVVGKTVTLELNPAQTEVIASAQAASSLSLSLRSLADSGEIPVEPQEISRSVRILRGGRSEVVSVQ
ncbi:Flp pilus assembly protein CpaB [Microvirga aerophila]|uniref:Flp pilus assembly protein CpaB n=1 Tax=Microvirga aerophila TaxID=670291 RepID=A0A512BY70_9HYPH|nr:Flp pilus assembly protein CpaB [Microvirga aerophila]GEO16898.1 Flp pilus assembly protein CpaB [Microvirga aerophila]